MAEKKCEIECGEYSCRIMGYTALKKEQRLLISQFMSGRDIFAVLPTGYGKSLCFACLPKAYDRLRGTTGSIAVVVTLLIAIMISGGREGKVTFSYFFFEDKSCPQATHTLAMLIHVVASPALFW